MVYERPNLWPLIFLIASSVVLLLALGVIGLQQRLNTPAEPDIPRMADVQHSDNEGIYGRWIVRTPGAQPVNWFLEDGFVLRFYPRSEKSIDGSWLGVSVSEPVAPDSDVYYADGTWEFGPFARTSIILKLRPDHSIVDSPPDDKYVLTDWQPLDEDKRMCVEESSGAVVILEREKKP